MFKNAFRYVTRKGLKSFILFLVVLIMSSLCLVGLSIKDATRLASTLANQAGYNADVVVEIMACCYNSASFLIDEKTGIIYDIQRTFCKDKAMTMQITAQRREHGKV